MTELTPDYLDAQDARLRERFIATLEICHPSPKGNEGCDADIALDLLVRFARARGRWEEHDDNRAFTDPARPTYCSGCHDFGCEAEAELLAIIEEAQS